MRFTLYEDSDAQKLKQFLSCYRSRSLMREQKEIGFQEKCSRTSAEHYFMRLQASSNRFNLIQFNTICNLFSTSCCLTIESSCFCIEIYTSTWWDICSFMNFNDHVNCWMLMTMASKIAASWRNTTMLSIENDTKGS